MAVMEVVGAAVKGVVADFVVVVAVRLMGRRQVLDR